MIDTHAHLEFESFDQDRPQVIERFFQQGGNAIITMGTDQITIDQALKLAQAYPKVFAGVGFHPEEALASPTPKYIDQAVQFLREKVTNLKVVAVGEIGLDYYHIPEMTETENTAVRTFQKQLLIAQLAIAKENGLPVVLHCRDAYDDLFDIVSQPEYAKLRMVIHCYGGSLEQTERFLTLPNISFSFTGTVTFVKANSELLQVVSMIPIERMMAETDSPYLSPVPMRGKRNEPSHVRYIIETIAKIKQIPASEAETITDQSAIRFFQL